MTSMIETLGLADPACARRAFWAGLRPDPDQTIDAWADAHVQLPPFVAESGQWRTSRTPFLKEIMECLSPRHPCTKVVFMKSVQIGGTQVAVNWMGYVIDRAPGAMLVVEPTVDVAKKLSKQKVQPMMDLTPCLTGKIKEARARDSGNSLFSKEFLGGMLVFTGANSGIGLRFMSARYLVLDEVDAYPADVDGEGHPAELAENRTATFARRKIFELSTPLEADSSRIEPDYEAGSRGRYYVPCPFCGHRQHLQWGQLIFTFDGEHRPHEAAYRCAGCARLIAEHHKTWMCDPSRAAWVHDDPENPTRSFHINALYMPYGWPLSWPELARRFLEANEKAKLGDVRALKVFVNTILAETWEEQGEKADETALYHRREVYEAECPAGVLVLTAAIDVQDDRLEVEVMGWGIDEESWSIDKRICVGNPAHPTVWKDVIDWVQRKRLHACGLALRVEALTVDTGGHHTQQAYWFVRRYRGRCYAIKGSNQQGAPLVPPRPTKPKGAAVQLYHVGTVAAKDTIFARFKLTEPGPGYIHFPRRPEYDEEHFKQLAAEEKRSQYERGVLVGYHYKKIRSRNEALDLMVYNLAAVALLNPHFAKLAEKQAAYVPQVELVTEDDPAEAGQPVAVATPASPPDPPVDKPEPTNFVKRYNPPRRRGGFVQGWR